MLYNLFERSIEMKKNTVVCFLILTILLSALCICFNAEDVVFTEQPKGGEVLVGKDFTITFGLNTEGRCMLQGRDNETYDWGNYDYISSPYVITGYDYERTEQYRLWVEKDGNDYYSDIFTIKWEYPDNMTEIEEDTYEFDTVYVGFEQQQVLPVIIKNIGDYDITDPVIYVPENSYLELIENKPINVIKAGETDSTSYSVRPRNNIGAGDYIDSVCVKADNLMFSMIHYRLVVEESGEGLQYSMSVDDIDFGVLNAGYGDVEDIDLVIRADGTGNLTNIHLFVDGQDTFFRIKATSASVDQLSAGFSTKNWYVHLEPELAPGEYSATIKVFADELDDPVEVNIKAVIEGEASQNGTTATSHNQNDDNSNDNNQLNQLIWIIIPVIAVLVALIVILVIVILKKKK